MITLLSPTRTMNMSPVLGTYPPATTPQFLSEAERIISGVKELSAKELEKQMNLSQEIAENDFHYFQQFDSPTTIQKQAVLAYSGAIYQKLDAIKAYRLMFSLKVPNLGTENLYQFWKPIITKALINDILTDGGILIQIYSKQSRGNIARYIVKNQINRPENIQQFNQDGYQFDKQLSTPDKYIFTR